MKRVKNDSEGGRDMEVAYIAYVEPTEKEVLLEQHPMSRYGRRRRLGQYKGQDLCGFISAGCHCASVDQLQPME